MLKIVSKLLLQGKLKFEEGKLWLFDIPISIIPSETIVELQKELEKTSSETLIYYAAKKTGRIWFKQMDESYHIKTKDVMKWGPAIIGLAGWGKVTVVTKKDSEKSLIVTLEESVNAKLYGSSKHPVDHLFRGLVCGAWCYVYGEDLSAIETHCMSMGHEKCKFVLKPTDKIDKTSPLVIKQLGLK